MLKKACFVIFLHTARYKKETKEQGKIVCVLSAYRIVQTLYMQKPNLSECTHLHKQDLRVYICS